MANKRAGRNRANPRNKPNQPKPTAKAPANVVSKPRRRRGAGVGDLARYAAMLADPCDSSLISGIFGATGASVQRLSSMWMAPTTAADDCGFLLWCPQYTCDGTNAGGSANGTHANFVAWQHTNSSTSLGNTIADPAYTGGVSAMYGSTIRDPAFEFCSNGYVRDARLISACIRATYVGSMTSSAGMIYPLENIPNGFVAGGGFSIDELCAYARRGSRVGVDTHEVRYKPDPSTADRFLQVDHGPVLLGTGAGSATTESSYVSYNAEPRWYGFAWTGLNTDNPNSLQFRFVKNIEYRTNPGSGIPASPTTYVSESLMGKALTLLDRRNPDWATRAGKAAATLAGRISIMALAGV